MRKLSPEDRETLINEMLERVLDIVADKGGENYLRSWWRAGRRGYDTMSDEELLQEATDRLGFDLDGPEMSDLEILGAAEGELATDVTDNAETDEPHGKNRRAWAPHRADKTSEPVRWSQNDIRQKRP